VAEIISECCGGYVLWSPDFILCKSVYELSGLPTPSYPPAPLLESLPTPPLCPSPLRASNLATWDRSSWPSVLHDIPSRSGELIILFSRLGMYSETLCLSVNRVTNKNVTHAIKTLHLYVTPFTVNYTV